MFCWGIFKRNLAISHIGIITYFEDFPIIVLEFLVCGIPVVTTNVSNVNSLIIKNKNGIVIGVEILKNFQKQFLFNKMNDQYKIKNKILEYDIKN